MVTVASEDLDKRRGVDFIGASVCFLVHDGKGRLLLQKRSQNCRDERGRWDIGGGAIEFGESVDEAVKRELQEELSCKPLTIDLLEAGDAHRTNHEGQKTHWVYLLHMVQVNAEDVKIGEPDKIDEIGWFTSKNLPAPRHSFFPRALKAAKTAGIID